jgi:hypothetical protein
MQEREGNKDQPRLSAKDAAAAYQPFRWQTH